MSEARAAPRWPSPAGLLFRQLRYQNRVFWRTPISAFFTFVFPLIFLVLFNLLFEDTVDTALGPVVYAQFFTPAIAAFAIVTASYTNLAITVTIARDEGILKRIRGTPLPPSAYLAARIASAAWIALLSTVIMFAIGALAYDFEILWEGVPAALVTLLVSAGSFCALGLALTGVLPNAESAPAVANATVLPIVFISGVFFPVDNAPTWIQRIGDAFPIKHAVDAMVQAFNPLPGGASFNWTDLGVIAAWGVAGIAVALRFFRWEPRREAPGGRRRRGAPAEPSA